MNLLVELKWGGTDCGEDYMMFNTDFMVGYWHRSENRYRAAICIGHGYEISEYCDTVAEARDWVESEVKKYCEKNHIKIV